MPLPDAPNTSPRVYTLLQNTDLENVTQPNLATLGNPISVEELNEDELRRLVLVNLARLSVKSEWNGLLNAAGGSEGIPFLNMATSLNASEKTHFVSAYPPFPRSVLAASSHTITTKVTLVPFILPKTLTFESMNININVGVAGDDLDGIIYESSTTTGVPTDKVTNSDVTFSTGVTTGITANFSSNIELEGGTLYWIGLVKNASSITLRSHASDGGYPQAPVQDLSSFNVACIQESTGSGSLPATITASDFTNVYGLVPLIGLVLA